MIFYWLFSVCWPGTICGSVAEISATGSEGFARVVRLLFGVPSVATFRARLVLFGLAMTSAGAAPSAGFEILLTAFTSVGIGVEEIAGLVYAV